MGYSAVIFDMDGTVLDTLGDLTNAVNAMLAEEGLAPVTAHHVRRSLGNGVEVLMEKCLPGGREYPRYQEAMTWYRSYYKEHNLRATAPYAGIPETLAALKQAGKVLAVVSNKQHEAVEPLSRHFFGDLMTLAIGERKGMRRKPAPDMVLAAMEQMSLEAKDCLYVGDSEVDVLTASHAGLDCAAVTWGFRDEPELRALAPKYLIHRPEELLELV